MCIARSKPIDLTEYPKLVEDHIFKLADGKYVFTDETDNFSDRYDSLEEAKAALERYGDWLTYGPDHWPRKLV